MVVVAKAVAKAVLVTKAKAVVVAKAVVNFRFQTAKKITDTTINTKSKNPTVVLNSILWSKVFTPNEDFTI